MTAGPERDGPRTGGAERGGRRRRNRFPAASHGNPQLQQEVGREGGREGGRAAPLLRKGAHGRVASTGNAAVARVAVWVGAMGTFTCLWTGARCFTSQGDGLGHFTLARTAGTARARARARRPGAGGLRRGVWRPGLPFPAPGPGFLSPLRRVSLLPWASASASGPGGGGGFPARRGAARRGPGTWEESGGSRGAASCASPDVRARLRLSLSRRSGRETRPDPARHGTARPRGLQPPASVCPGRGGRGGFVRGPGHAARGGSRRGRGFARGEAGRSGAFPETIARSRLPLGAARRRRRLGALPAPPGAKPFCRR